MKLEATTVVIEPRSVGACLDLALLFCRRHAGSLAAPTLAFAAMGALGAYVLAARGDGVLFWSTLLFFGGSPLLGAFVVLGAGHAVFGEAFAPWAALKALPWGRKLVFLLQTAAERLVVALAGLVCLFLPILPAAVYYGFYTEVYLLEQTAGGRTRSRISELTQHRYMNLLARAVVLSTFAVGATLTLFLLVDQAADILFGWPLLVGRLGRDTGLEGVLDAVSAFPPAAAVLVGLAWLVYPIVRLAWFFCYLDVRIVREAWDLELDFRVEADRLGALSA